MNATMIGKVFVFVQFVISTALLGVIAFGIFPHRNNPSANIDQGAGKMESTIKRLDDRIRDLAAGRDRADARWRDASQYLAFVEAQRPARQQLYAYRLNLGRTGLDGNGNRVATPVMVVEFDPNGVLKMVGAPIQYRGEELKSYDEIQRTLQDLHKNQNVNGQLMLGPIPEKQAQIKQLMAQHEQLTEEILGKPGVRGLRREKELQQEAKQRAIEEQEKLKPFLANRYAEALLALKRQGGLVARKQELEKVGVAAGGPEK